MVTPDKHEWMHINNDVFRVSEYPNYNPVTERFRRVSWYKGQKRKCIEGAWSSGKWIPGPLYYYINFHHIKHEDESSVSETITLPWLRDIDWELFLVYEEARGFSGFSEDAEYTCDRNYGPEKELALRLGRITEEQLKTRIYVPAREYLRMWHGASKGKPLYKNQAQHVLSIQARGGGKSYASSAIVAHNFLFDGATDYDEYLRRKADGNPYTSDSIVGAIDTKYTLPVFSKIEIGLDYLPGKTHFAGREYASPFMVSHHGSLAPNREWSSKNGSLLRHRTFRDNPLAANGTRANLVFLDEVGFMGNIKEAWGAIEALQASKQFRRLVIWALGTGGYVSGKAQLWAENMFRNPKANNCLEFPDIYDLTNKPIGYFVPYELTLNEFKEGKNKITNLEKSRLFIEETRNAAKEDPNPTTYITTVINGPQKPSEAFLVVEGGYFPAFQLKDRYQYLMQNQHILDHTFKGTILFDDAGLPQFHLNTNLKPIRSFPLTDEAKEGALEIFQKPQREFSTGQVAQNRYIIGCDTVDKARSTTDSLFCIIVFDRWSRKIVAEYTGRTDNPNDAYARVLKLALYYNAKVMYEQALTGLYTYMDHQKRLSLLADTPSALRNRKTYKPGTNTSKGVPPSESTNRQGREFILTWLKEKLDLTNLDYTPIQTIESPAILRELINWNPQAGNYDRVSALIMVMWYDNTLYRETAEQAAEHKSRALHPYYKKMKLVKKDLGDAGIKAQDPRIKEIITLAERAEKMNKKS